MNKTSVKFQAALRSYLNSIYLFVDIHSKKTDTFLTNFLIAFLGS